jgi:hypothetical protein
LGSWVEDRFTAATGKGLEENGFTVKYEMI